MSVNFPTPWRAERSGNWLKRRAIGTFYDSEGRFIGMAETPELAQRIVDAVNAKAEVEAR
jgi:hypothetical protein